MGTGSNRSSKVRFDRDARHALISAAGHPDSMIETLENRILLGGDHPSFMLPLDVVNSTPITLDGNGSGSDTGMIDPAGDDDLFSFTAPADDFVRVWADTVNTMDPSTLDSRIEVYDADGMLVGQGSSQGNLTAGMFEDGWAGFVAEMGETYFVRVMSDDNTGEGATGDYVVRVDAISEGITLETDDTLATFGLGSLDGTIALAGHDHVINVTTTDVAGFDSLATFGANLQVDMFGAVVDSLDTRLDIYDASGAKIAFDSQTGRLTNAFTTARSGLETTFFVRVRTDRFDPADMEATGAFTLDVDMGATVMPIDPVTRIGKLRAQGPIGGDLTNVWGFQSEGTGLHFVTVVGDPIPPFIPPQPDVAVRLYRDDGTLAGFNDDFSGNQAQIEIQLTGGTQYWVVIEAFDEAAVGGYALTIDAHHTFNTNAGVDDHIDSPGILEDVDDEQIILDTYHELEQATPLIFNAPFQNVDQFNNTLRDYGWQQTAFGTGRIHDSTDTDLFQFTLPVDHLGEYEGDNDDAGLSVYLGGLFDTVDSDYESQRISVWDGEDYFPAGQHFLDGSVRALRAWDADGAGPAPAWLFAGGDFTALDDADINPFGPTPVGGIAYFDPTQGGINDAGGWNPVTANAGFDGTIYAMEVFDAEDDGVASLYVGGDFMNVDGMASPFLVKVDMLAWSPLFGPTFAYTALTGTPDAVYALKSWLIDEETWDDGDYEIEFEEPPGEGFDGMDDVDLLPRLIVGGAFGALMHDGAAYTDADQTTGFNSSVFAGNGTVYAIESYDPPDIEGPGGTITTEPELILGGDFSDVDGVTGTQNIVRWVTTEIANPPPDTPSWEFNWVSAGGGANDVVRALHTWDSEGTFADDPVLVVGGDFTDIGPFITAWNGAGYTSMAPNGFGFDGPVHSLEVIADEDYIPAAGAIVTTPMVYVGGDYTSADGNAASNFARFTFIPAFGVYTWEGLGAGTDDTVFALQAYDEDSEDRWDRHDRPASRIGLVVAPEAAESFANMFITIYDSNFEVVMELGTNDTIAPPFPDPAGKINLALTTAEAFDLDDDQFAAPPMWAGETYYLEISSVTGTGRYSVALTSDALPPETDGDGVFDNVNSTIIEIPDEGNWAAAQTLELTYGGGPNDTDNGLGSASFPYPGFHIRGYRVTPSGNFITNVGDYGVIETPSDSDLYFFRAPTDGTIEVRTATFGILDQFAEVIGAGANVALIRDAELPLRSRLDTKITVFNNDFIQIGASDDSPAVSADITESYFGTLGERTFRPSDSRSVFNVTGGEGYFVLVESGQRDTYEAAVMSGDFSRVDWRVATGGYELLINAGPELDFDDDHTNTPPSAALGWGTPLVIDDLTGDGSIAAEIDNTFANPQDVDYFEYIAVNEGLVTLTIERTSGLLEANLNVIEQQDFTTITGGSAGPGGFLELTFNAKKGERFTFEVFSFVGSEGGYELTVDGVGFSDDHASEPKWTDASELTVLDFNGTASAVGSIEFAGDTDIFFFDPTTYDLATIELTAVSPFFDPLVRVYEVGVDPVGNPKLRQITFDDNGGNGLNSLAQFSITAPGRDTFIDDPVALEYNTYFVLVQGADRDRDIGDYALELTLTQTDDHPDISQFEFATPIVIVPATGDGEDNGEIEKVGDTDLFRFIAPAGGPTDVLISAPMGSDFNPTVQIIELDGDGNETVLASQTDSDSGANGSVLVSFNVTRENEYYILVTGDPMLTEVGTYNVSIDAPTLDDHANQTEFLFASAIGLAVSTGDGIATGEIETIGDTDLFTLTTINDGDLEITIGAPGSSIRPVITVFDQLEMQLVSVTDGEAGDEDGARDGSVTITIAGALKGAIYYLQVEGSNVFDANLDEFPVGAYTALIDGPMGIIGPDLDDHADDGNFDAATAIILSHVTGNANATGVIGEVDDTDLFTFLSLADGRAFVQLVTPPGTTHDLSVTIYGPDESMIAFDVAGVPGANASISFDIAAAGEQYYISVDAIGNGIGDYTVRIDTEPQTHFLYFPEGFSNNKIDEFVSVFNPNGTEVTYSIVLRYEDPNLDETILINQQTLGAGMRGGVTISQGSQGFLAPGVEKGTPYAIVVTSDAPIGASLSHYDFDVATGESFTSQTSDTWTFARVERVPGAVRDFLLFYNPNDHATVVSLTAFGPNGTVTLTQTVQANRRSGWDINALDELPTGIFGIVVNSEAADPADADDHMGIVASLTHFDVTTGEGFAVLGDHAGGAIVGVLPSLTEGLDSDAELVLFNPGNTTASITLTGEYINVPNLPSLNQVITLSAGQTLALSGQDLGLINDQAIGLRYTSNVAITLQGSETRFGDANSTAGITEVGQSFFFGDAFINAKQAGVTYLETMDFYNPADTSITITLEFNFSTGAQTSTTVTVDANGYAQVNLHELSEILDQGKLNFFGIAATSDSPFAATLTHYDLFLRGGWTAGGAPLGLTTQLADI